MDAKRSQLYSSLFLISLDETTFAAVKGYEAVGQRM